MQRIVVTGILCFALGLITCLLVVNLSSSPDETNEGVTVPSPHRSMRSLFSDCDDAPEPGTTSVLDNEALHASGSYVGYFALRNALNVPVVAVLMSDVDFDVLQVMTLAPGSGAKALVPGGHYRLGLLAGDQWCNLARGFEQGRKTDVIGGIAVPSGATIETTLGGDPTTGRLRVFYRRVPTPVGLPDAILVAWSGSTSYVSAPHASMQMPTGLHLVVTFISSFLTWLVLLALQRAFRPRLKLLRRTPQNGAGGALAGSCR